MKYDKEYAQERVRLLKVASEHGLNVVRCGTIKHLSGLLPHNSFVVVYLRPLRITEIQWACQDYPHILGAEFVGKIQGPTTSIKSIYVGDMNWGAVYKNERSWRVKPDNLTMRWQGESRTPQLPYPVFMTETVNSKIVGVKIKGFGFRSLGLQGLVDFKTLHKELLTKKEKSGKISNIVRDNSENISQAL